MKATGVQSSSALICADYKDIVSVNARKICTYNDALASINTVVEKATAIYQDCVRLHAGSAIDWCGGVAAVLNHDLEIQENIALLASWEKCTPDSCAVRIASNEDNIAATGGSASVGVTAKSSTCAWDVSTGANWLHPGASRGSGNGTATVTADFNSTSVLRTATVEVGPRSWSVWQAGRPCQYQVAPSTLTVPAGGSRGTIRVDASQGDCGWATGRSSSSQISAGFWGGPWPSTVGTGSLNLPFQVYPNTTGKPMTGELLVAGSHIAVTQAGGAGAILTHTLSLSAVSAGKSYSLRASIDNNSQVDTKGTVTAQFKLPQGLRATGLTPALTSSNWKCRLADLTCARNDVMRAKQWVRDDFSIEFEVTGDPASDLEVSLTTTVNGVPAESVTSYVLVAFPPVVNSVLSAFDHKIPATVNTFAPGEAISIYGSRLCLAARAASIPMPSFLAGCRVKLGSTYLRLYYASPTQINAFIPYDFKTGNAALIVERSWDQDALNPMWNRASDAQGLLVTSPIPTFLEIPQSGTYNIAIQLQDGGFVSPSRPLAAGQVVTLYLTGLGAMTEAVPNDQGAGRAVNATADVKISVGGVDAKLYYAGVQPEFPGLEQMTFLTPSFPLTGGATTVPLILKVGRFTTASYTVPAN